MSTAPGSRQCFLAANVLCGKMNKHQYRLSEEKIGQNEKLEEG